MAFCGPWGGRSGVGYGRRIGCWCDYGRSGGVVAVVSVVTSVILCSSCAEDKDSDDIYGLPRLFKHINTWLESEDQSPLVMVDQHMVGRKHVEMSVAGAGMNYFGHLVDELANLVRSLPWRNPENVVLIIDPEDMPSMVVRPE